ncbi:hypothetical protein E8D34_11740 [Nocardioides sp. GY 10113]|uniref:hypothetical protein n=1 Tax=Nocardioides sp. GY 10113 TaxID=2569761 RepID=UPI0010A82926|nr:hypothetical protein [Nocardioides sp. GY 10113]TIC79653.1 hypothetical protein E8D34_19930 [Nocardioides sp. GY 10113]TIC85778.1 hypothetical protein E8D34_11740 [Nocardioides sp. GY 10113]
MSSRRRSPALPALALAGALFLGACSAADPGRAGDAPPRPTGTGTATVAGTGSGTGLTPPGSRLRLGQSAVVSYAAGAGEGRVRIAVDQIERGAPEDLTELDLGEQAEGYVPYYVRFSVTGVAGSRTMADRSINESVRGVLDDGAAAQTLYVIGDWDHCTAVTFPSGFRDGRSISSCVPYLAREPRAVAAAQYAPPTGAYSNAEGSPVTWR